MEICAHMYKQAELSILIILLQACMEGNHTYDPCSPHSYLLVLGLLSTSHDPPSSVQHDVSWLAE